MSTRRVAVCLLLLTAMAFGQRHKPSIDPETKEGYVIQLIQQERDPVEKIKLMNEFAVEFPKSPSLSWIYDQLQPVYLEAKDYDKVLAVGQKMIEIDPTDLDAAHSMLLAAEKLKDPELLRKIATTCWQMGTKLVKSTTYLKTEYALQMVAYSEYSIAALANNENDKLKKADYTKALEQLNPKSPWLKASKSEFATLAQEGVGKDVLAAVAEKSLAGDPNNEDLLMVVADHYMARASSPAKVLEFATRTVEVLRNKTAPAGVSPEDFEKKKERYLGAAHYMIGVISSLQGRYSQADTNLRAALPTIRGSNAQVMGAVYYHLGYANYQLAEKGERQRIFDAIKFNEQCATIPSSYREQAQRNIDSIKSEYNLR